MTYQKDLNITITGFSKECFFNKKKKCGDKQLYLELNKNFERNFYTSQLVILKLGDEEIRVSMYDMKEAIKLLQDVHNAGK